MPSPYSAQLVSIEGADAIAFAQAQFSSNLDTLGEGRWQFSAWLDPQGRVRALFHLLRLDEQRLCLLLRGGDAASLAAALQRYVFRARVRVTAEPEKALGTGQPLPLHMVERHGETFALGCGSHSLVIGHGSDPDWRLAQLRAGWPWLPPNVLGEAVAPALGLGVLEATALDKGCYPGQEIVARLHYRGGNKRHLHRLQLSCPLPSGSVLREAEHPPVQLLDVVPADDAAEALAIVHDDLAEHLHEGFYAIHETQHVMVRSLGYAPCTQERGR